jgi:hypothetical protein
VDIDAVCEAIATAITTAQLDVNGHRVTATKFAPDSVVVPHFYTAEFAGDYDKTFGGPLTELVLTCRLALSSADDQSGQQQAKILVSTGTGTIHETFRGMRGDPGQPALSGACDDLHLRNVRGPRLFTIGEAAYYGLEFTVFVMG